ncbi:hypothetical protein CEXT_706031 [Caerostris extrusa]|uniref:Uncharacterized protein n=1 Tax=Caerostris extrusa TaxID=172846 RepID=A0AAV4XDQ2_CAEEX|nr:hypothetical protein CEXT_706031 [Caerostris extrusa]
MSMLHYTRSPRIPSPWQPAKMDSSLDPFQNPPFSRNVECVTHQAALYKFKRHIYSYDTPGNSNDAMLSHTQSEASW